MAETTIGNLTLGAVDGTTLFEQERTVSGSQVSEKVTSSSVANFVGTSAQFAGLSTTAKNLVGAINEAAQSGGGASVIQLTQAEYTALSTAEKMNGSIYKLTDKAIFYCLDEEYHPVKELTTAQYNALTTAEKNNGTIYIQTDAETTGEDIQVSSTDTRTIDEGIADANGQVIDYSTWQTMTPQEQAAAGKVYVPDFPTATPNATEIPMSSSESTSVAEAVESIAEIIKLYMLSPNSPLTIKPTAQGNYGIYILFGFFQKVGSRVLIVNIAGSNVSKISDVENNTTFSNENYTFSYSSENGLSIVTTAPGVSQVVAMKI